MFEAICVIAIVVFVGLMIFTIWNAVKVNKRNKAQDATNERIFMSQIEKDQKMKSEESHGKTEAVDVQTQPVNVEPAKPKTLDYDKYEDDTETDASNGSLKDFFK